MTRTTSLVVGLLLIAAPVFAAPGGLGPSTGPGQGRLQKDRTCVRQCRDTDRTCVQTALTTARMCGDETCSAELDAVQTACADGARNDACRAARATLTTCLTPCREASQTALGACYSQGRDCTDACPTATPTPAPGTKDPQCIAACRTALAGCGNTAYGDNRSCVDACEDLVGAARVACANGRSAACASARNAANQCLAACNQSLRDAGVACLNDAGACSAACPAKTATPTPAS